MENVGYVGNGPLVKTYIHQRKCDKYLGCGYKVLLFGTSIIRNLSREKRVINNLIVLLCAFNLGVGGDRASPTLKRIRETNFSKKEMNNLETVLIHTGSNDAATTSAPKIAARDVIYCGLQSKLNNPWIHIIISSILPRLETK